MPRRLTKKVATKLGSSISKAIGADRDTKPTFEYFGYDGLGIEIANSKFFTNDEFSGQQEVEGIVLKLLSEDDWGHLGIEVYESDPPWMFINIYDPSRLSDDKKPEGMITPEPTDPEDWEPKVGDQVWVDLQSWEGWTAKVTKIQGQKVWLEAKSKSGRSSGTYTTKLKNLRRLTE